MLIWYVFVFFSIIYYYIEMGLVLTYGADVWQYELSNPILLTMDAITITIFALDILVCFNCGNLYRGMIIMDKNRITK
jgi:hypothetical protein